MHLLQYNYHQILILIPLPLPLPLPYPLPSPLPLPLALLLFPFPLYVGTKDNCFKIEIDAKIIDDNKYFFVLKFTLTNFNQIIKCIKNKK